MMKIVLDLQDLVDDIIALSGLLAQRKMNNFQGKRFTKLHATEQSCESIGRLPTLQTREHSLILVL